jgi:hypothetical protein
MGDPGAKVRLADRCEMILRSDRHALKQGQRPVADFSGRAHEKSVPEPSGADRLTGEWRRAAAE